MVVSVDRNCLLQLVVVDRGNNKRGHLSERSVVVTATAPQPMSALIDREGWDDDHVRSREAPSANSRRGRLRDTEWTWDQCSRTLVRRPVEVRSVDDGEQHGHPGLDESVDQGKRRWLGPDGEVSGDGRSFRPRGEAVPGDRLTRRLPVGLTAPRTGVERSRA